MTTQKNAKPTAIEVNLLLQPYTGCETNSHVSDIVSEALQQVHHCDEKNAQYIEGVSTYLTNLGFIVEHGYLTGKEYRAVMLKQAELEHTRMEKERKKQRTESQKESKRGPSCNDSAIAGSDAHDDSAGAASSATQPAQGTASPQAATTSHVHCLDDRVYSSRCDELGSTGADRILD